MKRSLLILFIVFCFGVIKADFLRKNSNSIEPGIVISPINALPDYNIPFKANPYCSFPYWRIKAIPSSQNKLAVLNNRKEEKEISIPVSLT
jgi:hypothetical protein